MVHPFTEGKPTKSDGGSNSKVERDRKEDKDAGWSLRTGKQRVTMDPGIGGHFHTWWFLPPASHGQSANEDGAMDWLIWVKSMAMA